MRLKNTPTSTPTLEKNSETQTLRKNHIQEFGEIFKNDLGEGDLGEHAQNFAILGEEMELLK